jgi:hypothetical protein
VACPGRNQLLNFPEHDELSRIVITSDFSANSRVMVRHVWRWRRGLINASTDTILV